MRKTKSGNWNERVIVNGQRHSITRPTKREVQEEVALLKARGRRRRLGLPDPDARPEDITFNALADKFLDQYQRSPRSKRDLVQRLGSARKGFGHMWVADITADTLIEWRKALTVSDQTKHGRMRAVQQVLGYGVPKYLHTNPAAGLKLPAPRKRRVRPFESWDEVRLVAAALGPVWGPWLRFACATGLRPQEWQALEWRHIDLVAKVLHVEQAVVEGQVEQRTKTEDSDRFVQLQAEALAALTEIPRPLKGGLVFAAPGGSLVNLSNFRSRIWRPALVKAGVAIRPIKETRHTFATLALAAGADSAWVSRQLGHTQLQVMFDYYAAWLPAANELNIAKLDALSNRPQTGHIEEGATDA